MQIGVVSDTHRYKQMVKKVMQVLNHMDLIIHLGDNVEDVKEIEKFYHGNIINVRGNCDFTVDVPPERIEIIEGKKFLITHGHRYDVKYDLSRLRYRALEEEADIVLFGHTHVSEIAYEDGIYFVNPGSPSLPRNGLKSVAIISINDKIIRPDIIEL